MLSEEIGNQMEINNMSINFPNNTQMNYFNQ